MFISLAVVLAALAAVANVMYLRNVEDEAYDNAKRVRVWVVKGDIPRGTPGEKALASGAIRQDEIPKQFRPGTSLVDINVVRGKVALSNLTAGQVVVDGQFVEPRVAQVTSAQRIPAGNVAVTIKVDDVHGVAGLILPGDRVNLMVNEPPPPNSQAPGPTRVLMQNVLVLFVGDSAAPQAGETKAAAAPESDLVTFAVPPLAASKITYASNLPGGLYLSLIPPDYKPTELPPVDMGNLFNGGLTP